MKSKKLLITYILSIVLGIIASVFSFYESILCGFIVLFSFAIIICIFTLYIKNIYNEISKTSEYLTYLVNSADSLEIRDNCEGELSILKNNIYKTAKKLQTQTELLMEDKMWLSNSLADISHQLKTPITSMMVMMDLLSDEDLPLEKRKEFMKNISVQLDKMQWLIVTLLKISKFDAGTISLKEEKVNVKKVVEKSLSSFAIQAELRDIMIKTELSDAYFVGDFQWSVEAVQNIIKNCIEHTKNGGELSVSCTQTALSTQITIKDNGTGIAKEDINHIFERFYKGKNSSEDSVGIGLALSKSIVNREKGTIEVKSELGVGSTFIIKFYLSVV